MPQRSSEPLTHICFVPLAKALKMIKMQIVSSLDSPFVIEDMIKTELTKAKDTVEICVPWLEKGFVSILRSTLPSGLAVSLLTKIPQESDKTFCALQALERESSWCTDIMCTPWLHAKFIIVDSRDVLFGSANATSNGFYYNNEILANFTDVPDIAARFQQIFSQIRNQPSNLEWNMVKDYSGCAYYSAPQIRIMQLVKSFFRRNGNSEISLSLLVRFVQNNGYGFEAAKSTIQDMIRNGLLYEPHNDHIKSAQM